ncbi:MAG: hypothetical protein ACM3VX_06015 [Bacteroidota bacterium]
MTGIGGRSILSSFWRVLVASLVMGGVVWLWHGWLVVHVAGAGTVVQALRLSMAVGVGVVVYAGLVTALRVPEALAMWTVGRETLGRFTRRA